MERGNDSMGRAAKNSTVISRIARYSYGFCVNQIFDPNVHGVQDRWWDDERGQWMATNQMAWILKRVSYTETSDLIHIRLTLYTGPRATRWCRARVCSRENMQGRILDLWRLELLQWHLSLCP